MGTREKVRRQRMVSGNQLPFAVEMQLKTLGTTIRNLRAVVGDEVVNRILWHSMDGGKA